MTLALQDRPARTAAVRLSDIDEFDEATLVRLSDSVKRVLIDQLDAPTLRHLAWLMEQEQPAMVARRKLSDAGIDALPSPGSSSTPTPNPEGNHHHGHQRVPAME